ncbi:MAG: hypothetical protein IJU79_04030, partial [Desulfovibrionaceae bacterium]|nr:hypothetical protein [Desulfovibrionaceae bacterium]
GALTSLRDTLEYYGYAAPSDGSKEDAADNEEVDLNDFDPNLQQLIATFGLNAAAMQEMNCMSLADLAALSDEILTSKLGVAKGALTSLRDTLEYYGYTAPSDGSKEDTADNEEPDLTNFDPNLQQLIATFGLNAAAMQEMNCMSLADLAALSDEILTSKLGVAKGALTSLRNTLEYYGYSQAENASEQEESSDNEDVDLNDLDPNLQQLIVTFGLNVSTMQEMNCMSLADLAALSDDVLTSKLGVAKGALTSLRDTLEYYGYSQAENASDQEESSDNEEPETIEYDMQMQQLISTFGLNTSAMQKMHCISLADLAAASDDVLTNKLGVASENITSLRDTLEYYGYPNTHAQDDAPDTDGDYSEDSEESSKKEDTSCFDTHVLQIASTFGISLDVLKKWKFFTLHDLAKSTDAQLKSKLGVDGYTLITLRDTLNVFGNL